MIDLTGGIRSAPITLLTASPRRLGFSEARRSWCYSRVIEAPDSVEAGMHAFDRYAAVLRAIGQQDRPALVPLGVDPAARDRVGRKILRMWPEPEPEPEMEMGSPLVVLHPSAGIAWRRWPAERFAAVAEGLIGEMDARVLVVGVAGDRELADEISAQVSRPERVRFAAWPLEELIALFGRASLLVSNESGPTHIAAAVGTPIVTIFGPTSEALWRPVSVRPERLVVLRGDTCGPGCSGRTCVAEMKCLTALTAGRVLAEAKGLLSAEAGQLSVDGEASAPSPPSRPMPTATRVRAR